MSTLGDFSRVIEQMANERRARDDAYYAEALAGVESAKVGITQLTNENLLAFIVTWIGTSDPRMTQLNAELRDYAVQEALRRMAK